LRRAIETAPPPDRVLAGIVAHDDFHKTFALFLEAQRAFRGDRGSRLAEVAIDLVEIPLKSSA
jgi:hypothetical protein